MPDVVCLHWITRFAAFAEGDVEELIGRRRPTSSSKDISGGTDDRSLAVHTPGEMIPRPLNIRGNATMRRRGRTHERARRASD